MNNSMNANKISHKGIVRKTGDDFVTVVITSESACSGCHAEGACSLSGKEEKIVEVRGKYDFKEGDNVTVLMEQSIGFMALFLGYVLPLIIVILTLIILISSDYSELTAGILSVLSLMPYYGFLWLIRKKINDRFTFSLKI
jgi:sigma-E factor negative regulatory protein RseC